MYKYTCICKLWEDLMIIIWFESTVEMSFARSVHKFIRWGPLLRPWATVFPVTLQWPTEWVRDEVKMSGREVARRTI